MVSWSDRFCDKWRNDYLIPGIEQLEFHHLNRAMSFLGQALEDEKQEGGFGPRRNKDLVEEMLFFRNRHLFSQLDLAFFDTTSIYKEVIYEDTRYIVCFNERQARKDAADRQAIRESLQRQLKKGPKALVGNKGYRKYLKVAKDGACIDSAKVKAEARFDGKWELATNTDLPTDQVALKYKELRRVERIFRDVKSLLETRPV